MSEYRATATLVDGTKRDYTYQATENASKPDGKRAATSAAPAGWTEIRIGSIKIRKAN